MGLHIGKKASGILIISIVLVGIVLAVLILFVRASRAKAGDTSVLEGTQTDSVAKNTALPVNYTETKIFSAAISGQPMDPNVTAALGQLAEAERSQGFSPGLGLAESTLYEKAGNLGAAVLAAFKEVFYAYSYGYLEKKAVEERLSMVARTYPGNKAVEAAVEASRALLRLDGGMGLKSLSSLQIASYEIDSFPRWMERVFILESSDASQKPNRATVLEEYRATRSRYANQPLYWLMIARHSEGQYISDAAERVISLAPRGPFAAQGRELLAVSIGLPKSDASSLMSRMEIENIIQETASSGKVEQLAQLFPLLSLRDNPYTLYALGACRGLSESPAVKSFFLKAAKEHTGPFSSRLSERLRYIAGGKI
ncbi:hypothetical protein [Gracilinema caldarium]|uniref:hypothetical protein n=1 Tax=Gracilinema caldarium TaxID=215591 RepID=UPI0026EFA036|nr:hypothetical protein [Gracilinema caldarium]